VHQPSRVSGWISLRKSARENQKYNADIAFAYAFLEPSPDAQILSLRLTGFSATNTACIDKK